MSIFSKRTKCPVCGKPVRGIHNMMIADGVPICKICALQVEMDDEKLADASAEMLRKHIAYRKENYELYKSLQIDKEVLYDEGSLRCDSAKQKWYIDDHSLRLNPPVFDYKDIVSYALYEDNSLIFHGGETQTQQLIPLYAESEPAKQWMEGEFRERDHIGSIRIELLLRSPYISTLTIELLPFAVELHRGSRLHQHEKENAIALTAFIEGICHAAQIQNGEVSGA